MFPSSTYTSRRRELIHKISDGLILLQGNQEVGMNYGANVYHFRQDSNFLYFIGIDRAGLHAIIDCNSGEEWVFGEEATMDDVVWTGPLPTLAEEAAKAGISKVLPLSELPKMLESAQSRGRKIHFLPPYRGENTINLFNWLGVKPRDAKASASMDLIRAIVSIRSYKTAEEVVEIEKAVRITNAMHRAAMREARAGMSEAELVAKVVQPPYSRDNLTSFPVILTVNGQVLHQHGHQGVLEAGRLCLVDAGAEAASHYAGDMTRTFPVDARFTTKQAEVYQTVLDAQLAAIAALRPGISYRDVHKIACLTIAEGMKSIGLMKGDMQAAVDQGAHALFFPHGLGHMMGLDVHDMEDLGENNVGYDAEITRSQQFGTAFLRLGRKLEPGFVLTVEPGIYFIPELIDMWGAEGKFAEFINYDQLQAYKDFGGIRIEDDYLITADGARLLGNVVPKTIKDVEAVRLEAIEK